MKKERKPEHSVLSCKVESDGRFTYQVDIDGEVKELNFHLAKFCKAQFVGETDWFSRDDLTKEWIKLTQNAAILAAYNPKQNRIARLLEKIAERALYDVILGE